MDCRKTIIELGSYACQKEYNLPLSSNKFTVRNCFSYYVSYLLFLFLDECLVIGHDNIA